MSEEMTITEVTNSENTENLSEKVNNNEEKTFTQSQLEEIISKRLERERKMSEPLKQVKNLLCEAKKRGLIDGNSYAEMAKQLMDKIKGQNEPTTDDTAAEETTPPCDSTPFYAEEDGKETLQDVAAENTSKEKNAFFEELSAIKQRHSSQNIQRLVSGDLFEKFAEGRNGRVSEIFDDFCLFMQKVSGENQDEQDGKTAVDPYSSTAFSNHSDTESAISGLTKQQMEMAKSAGLSYREYASILAGIPQKKNKNN